LKNVTKEKLEFQWKIALLDKTGLPTSVEQEKWFYRRSGMIMRSPFMLSSAWYDPNHQISAPNCVAEAAKDLGVADDRVRLALARAGLREGKKFSEWGSGRDWGGAADLDRKELLECAHSPVIETRVRADTADFHLLQVTQRPTFVIDTEIGDRAVFSGLPRRRRSRQPLILCSMTRMLTLHLARISARTCLIIDTRTSNVTILILPVAKCCLQLPLGSRIAGRRHGHRSRDNEECFGGTRCDRKCDRQIHGGAVHSRFAGMELDFNLQPQFRVNGRIRARESGSFWSHR